MPDSDDKLHGSLPLVLTPEQWANRQQPVNLRTMGALRPPGDRTMEFVRGDSLGIEHLIAPVNPNEAPEEAALRLHQATRKAELDHRRLVEEERNRIAERVEYVEPVEINPALLRERGIPPYYSQEQAEHTLGTLDERSRIESIAYLENDLTRVITLIKQAGYATAEDVKANAKSLDLSEFLVRDILPHVSDEIEARVVARNLLGIYGGDIKAAGNSYILNKFRLSPDDYYWQAADATAWATMDAALLSRYGGETADQFESDFGKTVGRNIDQNIFRLTSMGKTLLAQTESAYHGALSFGATVLGADRTADRLDNQHRFIQQYLTSDRIDTGNPTQDWLQDVAFIHAPLIASQKLPYMAFGSRMGAVVHHAGMWSSSLSSMIDNEVPLPLAVPLASVESAINRAIEKHFKIPGYDRAITSFSGSKLGQRPLGQAVIAGLGTAGEEGFKELLQGSVSKVTHDFASLGTPGVTIEEFKERLSSGWIEPVQGAATAGIVGAMGVGPRVLGAHLRHKDTIRRIDTVLDAAGGIAERKQDPERFKQTAGKIIENAKSFNQDVPAEVYLSAGRLDAIVPDATERNALLELMGATEEYSRSHATGADMCIGLEGYAAAVADHAKRAEFQKSIRVDPDGMTVAEAERSEEIGKRIQAEADALVHDGDAVGGTEPPPEFEAVRTELRQFDCLDVREADQLAATIYAAAKVAAEEEGGTIGQWIGTVHRRVPVPDQAGTHHDDAGLRSTPEARRSVPGRGEASPDAAAEKPVRTTEADAPSAAAPAPQSNAGESDGTSPHGVALTRLMRDNAAFATTVHDMGRAYLDQLEQGVKDGTAPESSRTAYESLLHLAGGKFDRDGLENVIRHWQASLHEDDAPSSKPVVAFDAFRSWLTDIYGNVRQNRRGENVDGATRSALDHLLASEREIRNVREYFYDRPERLENLIAFPPSVKREIDDKRREVESDELSRRDRVRIRAFLRALESREEIQDKARADVDAMPVYVAAETLVREGGSDEADAVLMVGPEKVAAIRKKFGDDVFGGATTPVHIVAGDHGYGDGAALLTEMADANGKAHDVSRRVREIVHERANRARHSLAETEVVPGDAAYHGGKRLELMALQLEGLRLVLNETRATPLRRLPLEAVVAAAEETVGRMRVRDVGRHRRYSTAERRYGRIALKAARDGDIGAAYDALQKQLFNHAVTAAMFTAWERRESFRKNHTDTKMIRALDALHEDYREPFRQLLTRYGVTSRPAVREGVGNERVVE
ncbi:MAG: hypothetical protein LIQ30_05400 [Planctomycetes bacterium]|nr:hypothetical protein [Planctomycetota bacterium]